MTEPLAPLTRDVGCRKDMMWATRLNPAVPVAELLAGLEREGFGKGAGAIPGRLAVFDQSDTGHRVIFVPRTGRIQIRLDALTRHEERVEAARVVYDILYRVVTEALGEAASSAPIGSSSAPYGQGGQNDADVGEAGA